MAMKRKSGLGKEIADEIAKVMAKHGSWLYGGDAPAGGAPFSHPPMSPLLTWNKPYPDDMRAKNEAKQSKAMNMSLLSSHSKGFTGGMDAMTAGMSKSGREQAEATKRLQELSKRSGQVAEGFKKVGSVLKMVPGFGFLAATGPVGMGIAGGYAAGRALQGFSEYRIGLASEANPNLGATYRKSEELKNITRGARYQAYTREQAYREQFLAWAAKERQAGRMSALDYLRANLDWATGAGSSGGKRLQEYKKTHPLLRSYEGLPTAKTMGIEEAYDLHQMAGLNVGPLEQKMLQEQISNMGLEIQRLSGAVNNLSTSLPRGGF